MTEPLAASLFSEGRSALQSPKAVTFGTFLGRLERGCATLAPNELARFAQDYLPALHDLCAQRFHMHARRVILRDVLKGKYPNTCPLIMHMDVNYDEVINMGHAERDTQVIESSALDSISALSFHDASALHLDTWMPFFEARFPSIQSLGVRFDYTMNASLEDGQRTIDTILSDSRCAQVRMLNIKVGRSPEFVRGALLAWAERAAQCIQLEELFWIQPLTLKDLDIILASLPASTRRLSIKLDLSSTSHTRLLHVLRDMPLARLQALRLEGLPDTCASELYELAKETAPDLCLDTKGRVAYSPDYKAWPSLT